MNLHQCGAVGATLSAMALSVEAAAAQERPRDISEIVVTAAADRTQASKTDARVSETPQSISVITNDQITLQGAETPSQALRYTAGAVAEPYGDDPRFDWVRIRGFAVNEFLDGMALPKGTYTWPRVELYGVSRAEVVRGPAAVLYGATPPGGLYNFVSKRPTQETQREIVLQTGDPGRVQGAIDIGGRADATGTFSYRLTALGRTGDTMVNHVEDDRIFVQPSLTWRPTSATSLTLLGYFIDDKSKSLQFLPSQGILTGNPNGMIPRHTFIGEPDYDRFDRQQYGLGYLFEHSFANGWSVHQNLRYSKADILLQGLRGTGFVVDQATRRPADYRTVNRRAFRFDETTDAFTVDSRLTIPFATGPFSHHVLVGIDYRHATNDYQMSNGLAPPLDIFNPAYGRLPGPLRAAVSTDQSQDQIGVYLQDQIRLGRLTLMLSGRQDWVETRTLDRLVSRTTRNEEDAFSGRAGLIYNFENGLAPYIAYSASFQPNLSVDQTGRPFDATTAEQIEAGLKFQPKGSNSLITASVYELTQKDAVLYNAATALNEQVGEIRVRGFELEGRLALSASLQAIAAYSYTDALTTKSTAPALEHKQVPTIPRHQASLWLDYTFRSGALRDLGISGGVRYVGDHQGDAANSVQVPSYTLIDAALRYDLGRVDGRLQGARLSLIASNLFDKAFVATCGDLNSCYWGAGRTVKAALSYRW